MNVPEENAIDTLLARYLANECDLSEKLQAENWIAASPENKVYFDGLQQIWNDAADTDASHFNTDAAWNRLQANMHNNTHKTSTFSFWKVAASVAAFLVLGVLTYTLIKDDVAEIPQLAFSTTDKIQNGTLPDGSKISLNSNSQLTYPKTFSGNTREVELNGQAFFDVAHDATHPFIIHTNAIDIRVVGTSFDVKAYPNSDSALVSVVSGKVKCFSGTDTTVLTAGQQIVFRKSKKEFVRTETGTDNTHSWRTRLFKFERKPLADALREIAASFQVKINVPEGLNKCLLTLDYDTNIQTVEEVLDLIHESYPATHWKRQGDVIIFGGEACP
jgi:transmembrane sensor